jgi:hypothetical protein
MKQLWTLLVVGTLFWGQFCGVHAQSPLNVGALIGANFSSLPTSGDQVASNYVGGLALGAFARVNIKKFLIQPEVMFMMKGASMEINPAGSTNREKVTFRTNHLDVPLMLGYNLVSLPLFKLRVVAGPVASFRLSESDELASFIERNQSSFSNYDNAQKFVNTTDWGFQAGLGADIWKICLDVRYAGSFTDIRSDMMKDLRNTVNNEPVFGSSVRNSLFRITVGYRFL